MPRNAPALPPQAVPPDKRTKPTIPPPFENSLPSGLAITWRMPDPFAMIAFDGVVPDPLTAAVLTLLEEEKATRSEFDPQKYRYSAQAIKGMYGLAAAMLETPRLDPAKEYGGNGTLGRREIGYQDVLTLYHLFLFKTRLPVVELADPGGAERAEMAPPASDGVQPDAGATGGDN